MNPMEEHAAEMESKILEGSRDERLLIEAAQGDPAQFADLYDRNFDPIYAFFARRVATREEAQDLTAEVFHQALASIRKFKWQGVPFVAWLYGIAAHLLAAHRQKLGNHADLQELDLRGVGDGIERSVMLGELVEGLPREQRIVLVRRFLDQKSIKEIAQELGRSEGAVKQLQLRALEKLRERMGSRI